MKDKIRKPIINISLISKNSRFYKPNFFFLKGDRYKAMERVFYATPEPLFLSQRVA